MNVQKLGTGTVHFLHKIKQSEGNLELLVLRTKSHTQNPTDFFQQTPRTFQAENDRVKKCFSIQTWLFWVS